MGRGGVGEARPAGAGDEFAGFRSSDEATMVPRVFFSRLLPGIEKPEELVISLYLFYLHGRRRGWPRLFSERQLAADAGLMRALSNLSELTPEEALTVGLSWAVSSGTVIRVAVQEAGQQGEAYLLNIPANRRAIERLQETELRLDEPPPPAAPAEAPNIFALYEENIGAITPIIADDLKDAEERYPPQWIEAAIREAVSLNKRSWRYIEAILRRYEAEGPDNEEAERDPEADWLERRYARGKRGAGRLR
jgi:DnaD/phage-associated family protein